MQPAPELTREVPPVFRLSGKVGKSTLEVPLFAGPQSDKALQTD